MMNMTTQPRLKSNTRSAFTLVEMTLAIVVGALVLLGVSGVFAAARNMDRIFGDQYEHTTQLHIAQMTIRRSLLSLQIQEDQRQTTQSTDGLNTSDTNPVDSRPRIILETDPVYANFPGQWQPQRLEVVLSTPPIALNMATKAAAWARINDRDQDSLDFSSADASAGVLRSVFELRPSGERERVMRGVGIMDPDPKADERNQLAAPAEDGWTLWWRPILLTEGNYLRYGGTPLADTVGTQDEIRYRLAGAIPLVENIELCSWTVYKSDERVDEYAAQSMSDLPAYAEFELMLKNGQYASWMFEVDWVLGDDPLELAEEDNISGTNDGTGSEDDANGGGGGGGGGGNDPSPPGDGGGVVIPPRGNNHNMGGGDT
tara:strand:- start:157307 stop:158425 length:1119 start_codon:yes stop_codon:yes gene_type:complete